MSASQCEWGRTTHQRIMSPAASLAGLTTTILSIILGLKNVWKTTDFSERFAQAYPAVVGAFFSFLVCVAIATFADARDMHRLARISLIAFFTGLFALFWAVLGLMGVRLVYSPLI